MGILVLFYISVKALFSTARWARERNWKMFSHGHSEHMLLVAALLVVVAFGICYMVPGLLGAFSYVTTTFFLFAGIGVLVLGFLQLYHTHKNGY